MKTSFSTKHSCSILSHSFIWRFAYLVRVFSWFIYLCTEREPMVFSWFSWNSIQSVRFHWWTVFRPVNKNKKTNGNLCEKVFLFTFILCSTAYLLLSIFFLFNRKIVCWVLFYSIFFRCLQTLYALFSFGLQGKKTQIRSYTYTVLWTEPPFSLSLSFFSLHSVV